MPNREPSKELCDTYKFKTWIEIRMTAIICLERGLCFKETNVYPNSFEIFNIVKNQNLIIFSLSNNSKERISGSLTIIKKMLRLLFLIPGLGEIFRIRIMKIIVKSWKSANPLTQASICLTVSTACVTPGRKGDSCTVLPFRTVLRISWRFLIDF